MAVNKSDWSYGWHGHRAGLALYYFDETILLNEHHELRFSIWLTTVPHQCCRQSPTVRHRHFNFVTNLQNLLKFSSRQHHDVGDILEAVKAKN